MNRTLFKASWQRMPSLLVGLVIFSFTACHSKKTSDYSLEPITVLQTEDLLSADGGTWFGLKGQSVITFVDPRSESDYIRAHIPGAIHLPFSEVKSRFREVEGGGILIVYSERYGDPLAKAMSKRLIELGAADVRTLDGGITAWQTAGKPVVSGKKSMPPNADSMSDG